jgi:hypothetical protein
MLLTRSLLTVLLVAALTVSQGLQSNTGACASGSNGSSAAIMDLHARSGTLPSCATHHPGGGSVPAGSGHCAVSLDCTAGAALVESSVWRQEAPTTNAAPYPAPSLPPTDTPEPLAPPPRS